MKKHIRFIMNKLTPAETERLAKFLEEMGECLAAIGKIQVHGFESTYPEDPETNREWLEKEMGDLKAAIHRMEKNGDVSSTTINERMEYKLKTGGKYLYYNKN